MKHPGIIGRWVSRTFALGLLLLFAATALAQVTTTGRLTGLVTDSNGAVVPNARIIVQNDNTKARFTVVTNKDGEWALPSIDNGTYTVTVNAAGFKETVVQGVKVDIGQGATVNVTLEVGNVGDQVVVTGGGEVLQTASTTVSSTITGRQIHELPFSTRDAMQLVLVLPGVQTPGTSRTSSINGLPKSSLNISLDGANIQDNFLKSTDGFFTSTQPKSDAVEEVTVSTATPGAESAGGGAVQIQFRTKQGSSQFHGALFWQHRNDALNANYYFNNIDGQPKNRILLNQFGGNIGGPILIPWLLKRRDKAFFFVNMEEFRLPQNYNGARSVLSDEARNGIFRYRDSAGSEQSIKLFEIAAAQNPRLPANVRPYATTPDPIIARALGLINDAAKSGVLRPRLDSSGQISDFNRLDLNFQDPGRNIRRFPTVRLDFNLTEMHHLEFVHNYQHYFSLPDGVNGTIAAFPGTGSILGGSTDRGSIYRNNFTFAMAERWTIKSNLVNEIRATSSGNGTTVFNRDFGPSPFSLFNGYALGQATAYVSGFQTYSGGSRRNTPVRTLTDNLFWSKGSHEFNFGFSYTRVSSFTQAVSSAFVPAVTMGLATNDPANTGATALFTA
ncbi:MAG: carboxypeptidase regulatory-like domain-containing protein, partial [Blastocatellia bacterium]